MDNLDFYKNYIITGKAWPEIQTQNEIIFEFSSEKEGEPYLDDFVISKRELAVIMSGNGKLRNDIERFFSQEVRTPNGKKQNLFDAATIIFLKTIH